MHVGIPRSGNVGQEPRFTFELQHALGCMESLLWSVVAVSLSRPGVEILRNPIAVVLRDVRHVTSQVGHWNMR